MTPDPTSLDTLHDIVLPAPVPWWPLASGWVVLLMVLSVGGLWWSWRLWVNWRANAYRHAALRELARLQSASGIAVLLRRTALARVPRSELAGRIGDEWIDWLETQSATVMEPSVRAQLTDGVYAREMPSGELDSLRVYAGQWIRTHRIESSKQEEGH